jgi:membrane-bound lytic murein transglycosylase B
VLSVPRRFGVLTVVSALVVLPMAPTAYADGASSASQAKADAGRSQVRLGHLETQLDQALTAYDAALGGLQTQVSAGVAAADTVQAGNDAVRAAEAERTGRLRALYMDGGQLGVLASLLAARSPQDLALRMDTAQRLVAGADAQVVTATEDANTARLAQVASDQRIGSALLYADDVTARADQVDRLVRAGRAELAHLSARARKLARQRLAAAAAAAAHSASSAASNVGAMGIPAGYLGLYHGAARTCQGMQWTLLAAVGQVESGHGRHNGPSSAGAIGPMQFRPKTFEAYAVDGNHDGRRDPWNPADAVYTAAHFLCAGGAGSATGVQRALLRYNNAQWYVDLVLAVQQRITAAY